MGAVSLFTDEEKKFKSQNWYEAKLRQRMGKLQSSGQKWPMVCFFFFSNPSSIIFWMLFTTNFGLWKHFSNLIDNMEKLYERKATCLK